MNCSVSKIRPMSRMKRIMPSRVIRTKAVSTRAAPRCRLRRAPFESLSGMLLSRMTTPLGRLTTRTGDGSHIDCSGAGLAIEGKRSEQAIHLEVFDRYSDVGGNRALKIQVQIDIRTGK